jgi:hypothetical protein
MLTDVKKSREALTVTGLSSESATVVGPNLYESCNGPCHDTHGVA